MDAAPPGARAMLRHADAPVWARFDPGWYCAVHDLQLTDAAALRFHLAHGQALGHAPNPLFDEAWYLRRHPDVAAQVASGAVESGFDHFCRDGFRDRRPHWLFDRDLAAASLGPQDDLYAAALRAGVAMHRLFDAASDVDGPVQAGAAYELYLRRLGLVDEEPRTSRLFDPRWYLSRYPEVAGAVARGEWRGALHHYLTNDSPESFDPLPEFSEAFYLGRNPDVEAAVRAGELRNGYEHFLSEGRRELRAPRADIDLAYYASSYADVARGLQDGSIRDVFLHCVERPQPRAASPSALSEMPPEHAAKALWRAQADELLPLLGRRPLDFTPDGEPDVSVVMVLHDQFALTLRALASLRGNVAGAIELVLVDSGSTDETRHLSRYVRGARLVRLDANVGFVRACNAAFPIAAAPLTLLLNNDVELGPGAVAAAVARMADPSVGAVGGKIVRAHGRLQEAGSIVWRDGVTEGYMRDASPLAPEANFVRDADFCSGAFLMVRSDALARLDGLDDDYAPAYFEDVDLCLRIAGLGLRIVYDPAVTLRHLEYGSAEDHAHSQARMRERRQTLCAKHPGVALRPRMSDAARASARFARPARTRVLMIEDLVPLRRIGSGFVRSNDILAAMAALGARVTVLPANGNAYDLAAVYADMPDSVEVMHDQSAATLAAFLDPRRDCYDVVWIARTHNLDKTVDALEAWFAGCAVRPRVVLDTEAVAATRSAARARLRGEPFGLIAALVAEFANVDLCDEVVAVNALDAATIGNLGIAPVTVLGHMREAAPTPRPWSERAGLLFVGSIHGAESPNHDGLVWLVDEVLPLVEAELGPQTRLTVIGHVADGVSLDRFAGHPRVTLRGEVTDARPAYDAARVFVAPTRWAGGVPYKVHEAASLGLPVVATGLLAAQLGWDDGLLAADASDPAAFAAAVLRLCRDEALWTQVRARAAARIEAENAAAPYVETIRRLIEPAREG